MNLSPRTHQSIFIYDKNFSTSTNSFIETKLTCPNSMSQTRESHKQSSSTNQLVHSQHLQPIDGIYEKTELVQEQLKIISKITKKKKYTNTNKNKKIINQISDNLEDDWVCPVAVALRKAGYNVPLRPSKSWLERDRKTQALLREQQTLSKEM